MWNEELFFDNKCSKTFTAHRNRNKKNNKKKTPPPTPYITKRIPALKTCLIPYYTILVKYVV